MALLRDAAIVAFVAVVGFYAYTTIDWTSLWRSYLEIIAALLTWLKVIKPRAVEPPLIRAASAGNLDEVQRIADKDPNVLYTTFDENNRSALYWASYHGHLPVVEYLVKNGLDVNQRSTGNWTALHAAAINSHHNVIGYLVKYGGDLTVRDENNLTPRKLVAYFDIADTEKYLRALEEEVFGTVVEYGAVLELQHTKSEKE